MSLLSRARALAARAPLASVYLVCAAPFLALALAQPVWSLVDEPWHTDLIDQYAHGVYPRIGVTTIRPETLAVMEKTGVYRWDFPLLPQPDPRLATFQPPPSSLRGHALRVWMSRHLWQFSMEAFQPPLFYAAAVPVWMLGTAVGGPFGGIYLVRVVDALLAAVVATAAFALASTLGARRKVGILAAALVALLPGFALNASQVTNDTASAALASLAVVAVVRWSASGWTWLRVVAVGALFGAGCLAKPIVVGLLPGIALGLWLGGRVPVWTRFLRWLLAGAVAALPVELWMIVNRLLLGSFTQAAAASRQSMLDPGPVGFADRVAAAINFAVTFYAGEPLQFTLRTGLPAAAIGLLIMLPLAAVGIWRLGRARLRPREDAAAFTILAAAVAGQLLVSAVYPALAGGYPPPGRYFYPALAPAAALMAAGLVKELQGRAVVIVAGAYLAITALTVGAYAIDLWPPPHVNRGVPPQSYEIRQLRGSANFAGLTVDLDQVAVSRGAQDSWLRVAASNAASAAVEWNPVPEIRDGRDDLGGGDYPSSAPLPEVIEPGQRVMGWVHLRVPSDELLSASGLDVTFLDVASADYRDVRDVGITPLLAE